MGAAVRPVILYVEDDPDTFRLTEARLRSRFELVWAQNDREACEVLRARGAELAAVLMDIELGGSLLDGLKLVQLLRGRFTQADVPDFARDVPVLPQVPVVVLTAHVGRYGEADAKAVGATEFVTKPIDFTRLSLALAQHHIQSAMASLTAR